MEKVSGLEEQLESIRSQRRSVLADELAASAREVGEHPLVVADVGEAGGNEVRQLALGVRDKLSAPGVIILGAVSDGKGSLIGVVSTPLVSAGLSAGDLIAPAARELGGGGSPDPELAQAGGPKGDRLSAALDVARADAERALGEL